MSANFIIPAFALTVLAVLFEDKLCEFEEWLKVKILRILGIKTKENQKPQLHIIKPQGKSVRLSNEYSLEQQECKVQNF